MSVIKVLAVAVVFAVFLIALEVERLVRALTGRTILMEDEP